MRVCMCVCVLGFILVEEKIRIAFLFIAENNIAGEFKKTRTLHYLDSLVGGVATI